MIPILFDSITEGQVPTNYGLGVLSSTIAAEITEELNGAFEMSLTYAADGIHAADIQPNRFILAKPNYTSAPQVFRIYRVGKNIKGKFEVKAQHISYDLSGKIITSGSASSAAEACVLLGAQAGAFTIDTDKTTAGLFNIEAPGSVRSFFGGKAGSMLDIYGGEWLFDNYTASLKAARGMDRGVTVRYGKNLTDLSQVLDMSNLCTGIVPYYIDPNGNKTVGGKVATGLVLDVDRDLAIDFSTDIDPDSSVTIADQLANRAARYIANNNLITVANSITLDFVQMQGLTERVDLGDTVHIYFEPLNITVSAKCIKTVWDVLEERYTKTTFGAARANIVDTIAANTKAAANSASRAYVNESSQLITGNKGGYVILDDDDGDGKPDQILIMNTDDKETATQVWRFNKGGLGYGTSYQGPFDDIALTSDGKINADRITTGTLTANIIKAGVLSDSQGNSSINMTTGRARMEYFQAKNSLELLNDSNRRKGYFYVDSGGNTLLYMRAASSDTYLVRLWANEANGAGVFQLAKTDGTTINEAGQTNAGGGGYGIRNASGVVVGRLESQNGGAYFSLADDVGTQNIYMSGTNGQIVCVSLVQTSSRKVKDNIKPLDDADKILELEAVSFDYNNKALGTNKRGFIAEDVAPILPGLVSPETDDRPASLDYLQMIPYLQAIIKRHDSENKRLRAEIDELKAQVNDLAEKIKAMEG